MRKLALTLVPLLLLACNREATAPGSGLSPTFAATTTWTEEVWVLDVDVPFGVTTCVGEPWHVHGRAPYSVHEVSDGAGGYRYFVRFAPPARWEEPLSLTGLWTSRVWWLKNAEPELTIEFAIGPGQVYTSLYHEMYETADRQRLYSEGRYHFTMNANGELTVDRTYDLFACDKRHS
jgi:hypothetical protein